MKSNSNKRRGDHSKSKKANIVILVCSTSSHPVLHFYQLSSKYSEGYWCYRVDTKSNSNTRGEIKIFLLCWGLMTHQPLWVILCHLPERGRKEIEEMVEEMKEGQGGKRNRKESKETEEIKNTPVTLACYKDSRPCPTVSQYLDTR